MFVRKRARGPDPEEGEEVAGRSKRKYAKMETKIDHLLKELIELKSTVAAKDDIGKVKDRIGRLEDAQENQSLVQADIQK